MKSSFGVALGGGRQVKTAQVTGKVGNGRADFHLPKAANLYPCGHKLWLMLVLMLELVEQRDGSVSKRGREGGRRGAGGGAVQCRDLGALPSVGLWSCRWLEETTVWSSKALSFGLPPPFPCFHGIVTVSSQSLYGWDPDVWVSTSCQVQKSVHFL